MLVPKCGKKALYGKIRKFLGPVFRKLAWQHESEVMEEHRIPVHVHMLVPIPTKYSVAEVIGYIKGNWTAKGPTK